MTGKSAKYNQIKSQGILLGNDGEEFEPGLWEDSVYWGADNFVYHLNAVKGRAGLKVTIMGKRPVGEYLRWVDGLYRPGEIPSEANAIHYRAAKKLRELI
jgi:hypothetical protein